MDFKKIQSTVLQSIASYDSITIFRHVGADPDALGSQFGLAQFIKDKYPRKNVYVVGEDVGPSIVHFGEIDTVSDETIKNSLAIVLDTANAARVDDKRYISAHKTIRIDHHIHIEDFCDEEYIDVAAGATCQILADMFQANNEVLSPACARYLYLGIIADTIRFSVEATSQKTLEVAAYLASFGLQIAKLNEEMFSVSKKQFQLENYLRSHYQEYKNTIAYILVTKEMCNELGMTYAEVKSKVYVLANIDEYEIWCLFVEDETVSTDQNINASLRSRSVSIDKVANKYNGGGHRLACGVKGLDSSTMQSILEDLHQAIQEDK